jgi:hypothetical protein
LKLILEPDHEEFRQSMTMLTCCLHKPWMLLLAACFGFEWCANGSQLEIAGLSVTPHVQSKSMRYRRDPDPELGARVELFLRNQDQVPLTMAPEFSATFDGQSAGHWLASGDWAWHDTPSARSNETLSLAPGAMTVWSFNSKVSKWGEGTHHQLVLGNDSSTPLGFHLEKPTVWLSAVTFLGEGDSVHPVRIVIHIANESGHSVTPHACRLWLPAGHSNYRVLYPQDWLRNVHRFPIGTGIQSGGKGGFVVETGPLPLTYCAVEVETSTQEGEVSSLWAHLRIKREMFDMGGGWVADRVGDSNTLQAVPYLKTLRRMHINSGMHQDVTGYSDTSLFDQYPLKYMNRLEPFERYDTGLMLPRIHAVEFQGEPQYGGGRPVPPQEVLTRFLPYGPTRLPTSVTHSEERIWRYYAGLSDYPHYDAYRVCAPAPDSWTRYDRWGGERLRWAAPLETIADMTRSLRELNRPRPIAYWSQGAHDGWGRYGGRQRTSPTPDELRAQAYHALSQRITSLYWFNLSLKSLLKFRDLIEPITRVNREIRLMEDLLLEGDAFEYRREIEEGQLSWDLASVMGPSGGLLFAHDLAYVPDLDEKVFKFRPRDGLFVFKLPAYLSQPTQVFRLDADGLHDVTFTVEENRIILRDRVKVAGIYVVSQNDHLRASLEARHASLIAFERGFGFDPAHSDSDFEALKQILP